MRVHFSIDDVFWTLRWAYFNNPDSIFDMCFYESLRNFHNKYGIKVTLYLFASNNEDFSLELLPQKYIKEFEDNRDWLKVAYHGVFASDYLLDTEGIFLKEQLMVTKVFKKNLATTVRLHGWNASWQELEYVKMIGNVKKILCPYDERDFFQEMNNEDKIRIRKGDVLRIGEIAYCKTDYNLDYLENITLCDELLNFSKEEIYLFLHEWRFKDEINALDDLWNYYAKKDVIYFGD